MSEHAPREEPALTFAWTRTGGSLAALAAFLLISFGAHVATFFLFRVVYPERASIPPPAPRVSLLSASRPDHQPLLRWVEAEDPSLTATAAAVAPAHLLEVPYRASYETVRTPLRPVPEAKPVATFLPARSPLEVIRGASRKTAPEAPPTSPRATQVLFSGSLSTRPLADSRALDLTEKSPAPLEPARFLIGVTSAGEPRYVFPQNSSGHPALDAAAATHLSRTVFAADEAAITWGFATIQWGDDAYASTRVP